MYARGTPATAQRPTVALGRQLQARRKVLRLSVQDVADRAGVAPPTLERLERGDMAVGVGAFLGVLTALDLLDALRVVLEGDS